MKTALAGDGNLPGIDWYELTACANDVCSANVLLELIFEFDVMQTVLSVLIFLLRANRCLSLLLGTVLLIHPMLLSLMGYLTVNWLSLH